VCERQRVCVILNERERERERERALSTVFSEGSRLAHISEVSLKVSLRGISLVHVRIHTHTNTHTQYRSLYLYHTHTHTHTHCTALANKQQHTGAASGAVVARGGFRGQKNVFSIECVPKEFRRRRTALYKRRFAEVRRGVQS
jgi:hypothetical protein